MMPARCKVAIGLPVMNGEEFLPSTLDALLAQTYRDFELIISDNASTDRTGEICRQYAAHDHRIRYIRQPQNLGAVPNFNRVFQVSESTYFKWAAVDDHCDPTYLEKAVAVLDSDPDVVWCHSRSSHIDGKGHLLADPESLEVSYREREAASASERFRAVLLGSKGCLDSYGLIRSDAIRRTPLYLPYYGPEKVFIAELALIGRYKEIPETLFFPRVIARGSGNMQTAAEQQAFIDARRTRKFPLTRLRFLLGYLSAIRRSAPGRGEAARSLLNVMQWLFQVSKWRSIILKAVRGEGVGGGNVERVKRIEERSGAVPPR